MTPTLQLPRTFLARGSLLALPEELKALGLERPLLVTDSGLVKCGVFGRVCKVLDGAVSYAVFDAVPENPTYDGVDRAAEVYRSQGCDGAVAIGGGSVIDTAKLVAVLGGHAGTFRPPPGPAVRHRTRAFIPTPAPLHRASLAATSYLGSRFATPKRPSRCRRG
jgi:alcohol dehydrogenase class IV